VLLPSSLYLARISSEVFIPVSEHVLLSLTCALTLSCTVAKMKSSLFALGNFLLLFRVPVYAQVLPNAHGLKSRDTAIIPGYVDRGCYTEATTGRALSDNAYYDNGMTVEKCAAACGAYNWFGVEYGTECMFSQI
jgi:hypothetical protein